MQGEGWLVPQIWLLNSTKQHFNRDECLTHTLLHDHGGVREWFLLVASSNTEMRLNYQVDVCFSILTSGECCLEQMNEVTTKN